MDGENMDGGKSKSKTTMTDTKIDRYDQGRIFLLFYIDNVIPIRLAEAYNTTTQKVVGLIVDYAKVIKMPEWALSELYNKLNIVNIDDKIYDLS